MIKRYSKLKSAEEDYRGQHQAPDKDDTPIWDLTKVYPDDIYGPQAVQYYGDRSDEYSDAESIQILRSVKDRPNARVKIYRAVPKSVNPEAETIKKELNALYARMSKMGPFRDVFEPKAKELEEKLAQFPKPEKLTINPGDWVSINRGYVKQHGESTLLGKYQILTKTVYARDVWTDGNSIHEQGYDCSKSHV